MTLPRDDAPPGSHTAVSDPVARATPALHTENLAIVFTDIVGYTARTSRQTREENARLLAEHDRLLLPIVRAFGGRRVKSIGDALLLTFRSPTDSVLCGMAMQDRLARHATEHPGSERLVIRVAINLGEVRVERGDVFGEAVNVAARLEHETPPGEVWLTDAVQLSMNRAEVELEGVGTRELRGVSQPVLIHRVRQVAGPLPYGGTALARARTSPRLLDRMLGGGAVLAPALRSAGGWLTTVRSSPGARRAVRRGLAALGVAIVLLAALDAILASRPLGRAERALARGDSEAALALLEPLDRTAEVLVLRGRAQALAHRPGEALASWEEAAKLDPEALTSGPVLALLADELGGSRSQSAGDLLTRAGNPGRRVLIEATRSDAYRKRWAAVEALRRAHADDAVEMREVYLADLRVRDCNVVVRAAGKLADLGEARAIEPLRELAQRRAVLGLTDACEAPAARAALKKLEKR
ncbi:MAG TPA: adenylate/guanylate cyclase domain-containing protein [Myxococcaceae bacterium]|nr:adenylate/guanylate cyclase domain-containing protein [Myxococcaceae bacterium]